MPGIRELLLIAAIVAGVIIVKRLMRGGFGGGPGLGKGADDTALETEQCPRCHAYRTAGASCGRADCPYKDG